MRAIIGSVLTAAAVVFTALPSHAEEQDERSAMLILDGQSFEVEEPYDFDANVDLATILGEDPEVWSSNTKVHISDEDAFRFLVEVANAPADTMTLSPPIAFEEVDSSRVDALLRDLIEAAEASLRASEAGNVVDRTKPADWYSTHRMMYGDSGEECQSMAIGSLDTRDYEPVLGHNDLGAARDFQEMTVTVRVYLDCE